MPSSRNPAVTVKPGPGRLSASVATSSIFAYDENIDDKIGFPHSLLTDLSEPDCHPATAIKTDTVNFGHILSSADVDVQKACDTLDDHTHPAGEITVDTSGFSGILSSADDFVQLALGTIDLHNHDTLYAKLPIVAATPGRVAIWDSSSTLADDYNPIVLGGVGSSVGLGGLTPTARLHLPAGGSAPNEAPLKFTIGPLLSALENGAMEFNGSHLYFTLGGTRSQLDNQSGGGGGGVIISPNVVVVDFDYTSMGTSLFSTITIPENSLINRTTVIVDTAFTGGSGPTCLVDVDGASVDTVLSDTTQNDLSEVKQWDVFDITKIPVGEGGLVRVTLGGTASAGTGRIVVEYELPSTTSGTYVRTNVPDIIIAQHDFAPVSIQAPFTIGANAQGQLVAGLNADMLDGKHVSELLQGDTYTNLSVAAGIAWVTLGSTPLDMNTVMTFEATISALDLITGDTGGWVLRGNVCRGVGFVIVNNVVKEILQLSSLEWDVRADGGATDLNFDCMPDDTNTTKWQVKVLYSKV